MLAEVTFVSIPFHSESTAVNAFDVVLYVVNTKFGDFGPKLIVDFVNTGWAWSRLEGNYKT